MTDWKLIEVETEPEWTQDKSRMYAIVHRVVTREPHKGYAGDRVRVRVDLMVRPHLRSVSTTDIPLISWIGSADAVRKTVSKYLDAGFVSVSYEHAAYIGAEIARAGLDSGYVQS